MDCRRAFLRNTGGEMRVRQMDEANSQSRMLAMRAGFLQRAAILSIALALTTWTVARAGDATPPKPQQISHKQEIHGRTLNDEYFWLRERDNPKVMEHLKAENAFTAAMTAHLKPLEDKLYAECLARIQQTDLSVPYLDNGYYYY